MPTPLQDMRERRRATAETDANLGKIDSSLRVRAAVPLRTLTGEVHREWWAVLRGGGLLRPAVTTRGYAATRHALRGSTYRLVAELLSGERTSTDRPLTHCGPLPLPGPVGETLVATLVGWQLPPAIVAAAVVAVGHPMSEAGR